MYVPWPIVHATALLRNYLGQSSRPADVGSLSVGLLSLDVVVWSIEKSILGYCRGMRKSWRKAIKAWRGIDHKPGAVGSWRWRAPRLNRLVAKFRRIR